MIGERPVSRVTLGLWAVFAYGLQAFAVTSPQLNPSYDLKLEASRLMNVAIRAIQQECVSRGIPIDTWYDPNRTCLIGPPMTEIVTDRGTLDAKLIVTNPSFAAVAVDLLKHAGVKHGDRVAVAFTGSMPGANIAVLSACEALGLRPMIISSLGSSSYGATRPGLTWLDMETLLYHKGVFSFKSLAASFGGNKDTAENLSVEGQRMIADAIARNNVLKIEASSVDESISRRIALYEHSAAGEPIRAYINVGGGVASIGPGVNRKLLPAGLSMELNPDQFTARSVVAEMAARNIPAIHLLDIRRIAQAYQLSTYPVPLPPIGSEPVFYEERYAVGPTVLLTFLLVIGSILVVELDLLGIPRLVDRFRRRPRRTQHS